MTITSSILTGEPALSDAWTGRLLPRLTDTAIAACRPDHGVNATSPRRALAGSSRRVSRRTDDLPVTDDMSCVRDRIAIGVEGASGLATMLVGKVVCLDALRPADPTDAGRLRLLGCNLGLRHHHVVERGMARFAITADRSWLRAIPPGPCSSDALPRLARQRLRVERRHVQLPRCPRTARTPPSTRRTCRATIVPTLLRAARSSRALLERP